MKMTSDVWQLEHLHQLIQFGERLSRFEGDELRIVHMDDNLCQLFGGSLEEILIRSRRKVSRLIYESDREKTCQTMREMLRQEGCCTCRYRIQKKEGLIWVWESAICDKDEQGNEVIRSLVVDISAEEEIRKERDTTYDNIPGGVMTLLVTGHNFYITRANHQYFTMVGVEENQYLGSSGIYTFAQDLPGLRLHILEQAAKQEPIEYDFRTKHPAYQTTRWYRMLGRYYQNVGEDCEYLCILLDITEQKKNLFQLQREKERYRIASGIMAHVLFEYDIDKRQLQLYEDTENMGFRLCIEKKVKGSLHKIMMESGLLHEQDEEKFYSALGEGISAVTPIRLLTEDRKTGEKSYQWYEYAATKVMEQGRLTRVIGSVKNIQEKKRQEEKQNDVQTIFESQSRKVYEMLLQVDTKSREVKGYFTNGVEFTSIFPTGSYDEFVKKMAAHYIHPDEREQFLDILQLDNMSEILSSSSMEEILFFRIRKPGKGYRYKCIRFSYMGNHSDLIILTSQDMHKFRTRYIKQEEADRRVMAAALGEAKEMVELRRNFLTLLAREVKGPVQFIHTSLHRQEMTDHSLAQMQAASRYILEIIQNLADYERIEQGIIRPENRSFSLNQTMRDILGEWESRAIRMGIALEYSLDFRWDMHFGDADHFRQIVDNIIGNSLMNTETGRKLNVWGSVEERRGGVSSLLLVFEDQGVPIQDQFFGREYPIDQLNNRVDWKREEGLICTTFSLMLARRLAEFLGGHLTLERRGEDVNVIRLELPFQREVGASVSQMEGKRELVSRQAMLDRYHILVVQKQDADSEMVGVSLRVNGAGVDVAETGREGLERWKDYEEKIFDAVLAEEYLPDMDVTSFVSEFRQLKGTDTIPVFVLTDDIRQESVCAGMKQGVNAFVKKPLDLKRLQQMLDAYYRK